MQNLCRHFGICGGCDSQDKLYAEQLKDKECRIREIFSQFDIKEFSPIVPSPQIFYYRNKMEYAVGGEANLPLIGLREKKRFYKVVDLEECKIFSEDIKKIFDIFKCWIRDFGVEPYQSRRRCGVIRYACLRHSKFYDELMLIVVVTSPEVNIDPLLDKLKDINNLRSVYLCINDKPADISMTGSLRLLYGEQYIKERIGGVDYLISPGSFFQTNSYCCKELYDIIKKETASMGGKAIDLCCGSGGIALQIAANFDKIIGVDISQQNIKDALKNAALNNISNTEFICEDAQAFLLKNIGSKTAEEFSAIIVDPPRAGLSKKSRQAIADSGINNLIYVSCNPVNLAEDLKVLCGYYSIDRIVPVDMFPHTRHIETVAILKSNRV